MEDREFGTLVSLEPSVEYHSSDAEVLTCDRNPVGGQFQAGSLTGAVASKKVTEVPKGSLSAVGNRANRV